MTANSTEVATHTPTPWHVEEPKDWPFKFGVFSADNRVIVEMGGPHSSCQRTVEDWRNGVGFDGVGIWSREAAISGVAEAEGNARLIVRAVNAHADLLAALKAVMAFLYTDKPRKLDEALTWRANDDAVRAMVTAALAKAEGAK